MTTPLDDTTLPLEGGQIALSALTKAPFAMVLTDPRQADNPIVYVNDAFTEVTGYSRAAAIGRNCRFLQGPETERAALDAIRDAVVEGRSVTTDLRNYRADGSAFWNRLMIAPLADDSTRPRYFLGVQMALPEDGPRPPEVRSRELDAALSEIQHRVKNHLSMIVGMIRVQARASSAREEFETLSHRIEALQLLYEEMSEAVKDGSSNRAPVSLGSYLSRVANAIAHIDGRRGVRVNIDVDAVSMAFEDATRLGLITSELMTNAMQHAFLGREAGMVEMRLKELSNGTLRLQISDDGVGLPDGATWPDESSLGGRIVSQLVEALDAGLSVARGSAGTIISVDVPRRQDL